MIENKVTIAGLDEYVQVVERRVLFLKFLSLNATDADGGFTKYDVAEPSTCSEMVNKVLQAASLTDTFQKAVTDGTANDEVKRAAAKQFLRLCNGNRRQTRSSEHLPWGCKLA